MNRLSYIIYGDSIFTGRTFIWDFAFLMMQRRPLLRWGYKSFWLMGTDASSVVEAPGFVKLMPSAHYYDTMLKLGNVGYILLIMFIITTFRAVGRVADRNLRRAWLSLALFSIIYDYLESLWMRGLEFVSVVFVIVAVEIGRYHLRGQVRRTRRGPKGEAVRVLLKRGVGRTTPVRHGRIAYD